MTRNRSVIIAIAGIGTLVGLLSSSTFLSAQTAPASAQNESTLKNLSLEQLGNIEVTTTSKEPVEVWQTPAAIYVITQQDIERSGATTIADALRLAPGVEVARIDSDHWAVGIRGFGSQFSKSLLVLIDGRSVYTPLFAGVYWAIQDIVLDDIERIEVIRGPGGTIWGSNAVNGVINIITKSAQKTKGIRVSAKGGNVDRGIGSVRYGAGDDRFAYRVYGKGFDRGPEFHTSGDNFDDWHNAQGGFRTDWAADRDTVAVHGDLYESVQGTQVQNATFAPPGSTLINSDILFSGGNLVSQWRRRFSSDSDLDLQVYWDHTHQGGPQAIETRNTLDIDFIHHFALKSRNSLTWGVEVRESPSRFRQVEPSHNFIPADQNDSIYSAFLQDDVKFGKQTQVTIGSKFERNIYTGWEFEPTVRFLWTPTDHQSAWAAVTRAVRTPARLDEDFSLYLLALQSPLVYAHVVGNPALSSESLLGYEVGYRVLAGSRLYFDIAGFYNQYNDLVGLSNTTISTATTPVTTPPATYLVGTIPWTNAIGGHTDGFEIAPDWQPFTFWQLKGSYSYLHLTLSTKAGLTSNSTRDSYLGSSPHHEISIQSEFTLPHGFELDQTYRFVSALPYQNVAAYHSVDLRAAVRFGSETLSVVGQNLLQPYHFEFNTDPGGLVGIQRSVYGQITWTK